MRIDKYLWCVRIFKTRSQASEACRKGRVKINETEAKPARELRAGDVIELRINPVWKRFEVIGFPKSRVGAGLVAEYLRDTTPGEVLQELEKVQRMNAANRQAGMYGRPTKKQRRNLDRFRDA